MSETIITVGGEDYRVTPGSLALEPKYRLYNALMHDVEHAPWAETEVWHMEDPMGRIFDSDSVGRMALERTLQDLEARSLVSRSADGQIVPGEQAGF